MRVLIVEENADLGQIWARTIARLGVEVCVATSQSEAVDIMREGDVSVIILDCAKQRFSFRDCRLCIISDAGCQSDLCDQHNVLFRRIYFPSHSKCVRVCSKRNAPGRPCRYG